jgi:hypothetical protein
MLLESDAAAYRCLTHPDAGVRQAALYFLYAYWKQGRAHRADILRLASHDPDAGVRESAIGFLGDLHYRSKDRDTARFLAEIAN